MSAAGEVPKEAQAALQNVVDAGQAEWYLSGGEKIEFTAIGFCAWYMAERQRIRDQLVEELREKHGPFDISGEDGEFDEGVLAAIATVRGES